MKPESKEKVEVKEKEEEKLTAVQYYKLGYDFQQKKNIPQKAFENYKKAAETDPNYANAYFGMASVQKSWKQYENSLENYNKFVGLNPSYADGSLLIYKIWIRKPKQFIILIITLPFYNIRHLQPRGHKVLHGAVRGRAEGLQQGNRAAS